jgi:molybdopterin converting factor small subunit
MATVFIPPELRELTGGADRVEARGATLRKIVAGLEARYPGIRERLCAADDLRPGLAVAVNGTVSSTGLLQKVPEGAEVHFLPAISGG